MSRLVRRKAVMKESKEMGKQTVVGLFANSHDAQDSVIRLFSIGLRVEDIGFLEPDDLPRRKTPWRMLAGLLSPGTTSDDETYFMSEIRAGRFMVAARVGDYATVATAAAALHDCNALEVNSLDSVLLRAPLRHPTGTSMLAAPVAADGHAEAKVA